MEENTKITLENVLNEYNKYVMSRLINKEYNFKALRDKVKEISDDTDFIQYNDKMSDYEVVKNIQEFIQRMTKGKIFKIE